MRTSTRRRHRLFTRKDTFELLICIALAGLFVLLSSGTAFGQGNVGINNPTPHAKSLLDLTSTDKGLLTPRMTAAQRTAMFPVADATGRGMLVYQTDGAQGFYYYDGAAWLPMSGGGAGWSTTGNAGTNPATNFLGTSDNQALAIRTNNLERVRIGATGNVGINTAAPASRLHVSVGAAGYAPNAGAVITAENSGPAYLNVLSGTSETGLLFGALNDPQNGGVIYNNAGNPNGFSFRTGGNTLRMRVANNGEVTIGDGVAMPGFRLGVVANSTNPAGAFQNINATGYSGLHFINNTGVARAHIGAGNASSPNWVNMGYTGTITAHPFVLTTNDLERMRIDVNGNVGIGTTAPARLLEVASANQSVVRSSSANTANGSVLELRNTTAGTNTLGAINFLDGLGTRGQLSYHLTDGMVFNTAAAERMRIDPGGNVGIGTTAPVRLLEVSSPAQGIQRISSANAVNGSVLELSNATAGNNTLGAINFLEGNVFNGQLGYHKTDGMTFRTFGTERMRLDVNGNLGLGTFAPSTRLHVVAAQAGAMAMTVQNTNAGGWSGTNYLASNGTGNATVGFDNATSNGFLGTTTAHPVTFITNWAERMRLTASGDLGVGTNAPAAKFDVVDAGSGIVARFNGTNPAGYSVAHWIRSDNVGAHVGFFNPGVGLPLAGNFVMGTFGSAPVSLTTNNIERVRIAVDGRVGIGTAAPTAELEVNGFTKLGSDAPAIRMKKLTGTTPAAQGSNVAIAHGLTASKILGVQVLIESSPGSWMPASDFFAGTALGFTVNATAITVVTSPGNSGAILSRPLKILITYEA